MRNKLLFRFVASIFFPLTLLVIVAHSPKSSAKVVPLAFDPPVYDLGVHYDRTGKAKFSSYLINQTDQAIRLKSIIVSCGCIATRVPPSTLLPRARVLIVGEVNLESKNGYFQSDLGVTNNTSTFPLLRLQGYVGDIARISVPKIQLTGAPQDFDIFINQSANAWRIENYHAPEGVNLFLKKESKSSDSRSKSLLVDTFSVYEGSGCPAQEAASELVFSLTDGITKILCHLPIEVSELTASPDDIILLLGSSPLSSSATVIVTAAEKLDKINITSNIPSLKMAWSKLDDSHVKIDAECRSIPNLGLLKGTIIVRSVGTTLSIPVEVARLN